MSESLASALTRAIGIAVHEKSGRSIGGASSHSAHRYQTERGPIFVKVGLTGTAPAMFAAEAAGLRALADAGAIKTPQVLAVGNDDTHAFLCLEWIELTAPNRAAHGKLGERLAAMHQVQAQEHGWQQNNFIGASPQLNQTCADWATFFRERRLQPQLALARRNGADPAAINRGFQLAELLNVFFASYRPIPSLLHGDFWSGNWGATPEQEPVTFDPAAYFGDRETDIAMTRLFGGFGPEFYAAYHASWPLDEGAGTRSTLYNLYHVLNHFNLFRGGYFLQAQTMIERLLAELGR